MNKYHTIIAGIGDDELRQAVRELKILEETGVLLEGGAVREIMRRVQDEVKITGHDARTAVERDLIRLADDWEVNDFQAAIGYNPFEEPSHEAEHSGAAVAYDALKEARTLIDSVVFIATEGDTGPVLAQIDAVSGPAKTKAPKRRAASPG